MKKIAFLLTFFTIGFLFWACGASSKNNNITKEQPVRIANDSLEYEIIIIDVGFNNFLNFTAQPKGFYSQNYLENRNLIFVTQWNNRARNPQQFNGNVYENVIDYQQNIDYGYDVNYQLFNYFLFAQQKYKMSLGGARNRIR